MSKSENRADKPEKGKKKTSGIHELTAVFLFVVAAFAIAMQF